MIKKHKKLGKLQNIWDLEGVGLTRHLSNTLYIP